MTFGDLFCNTAAPDFAGKGAFDTKKFRQNGGDTGKPPYYDTVWDKDEYNQPCKVRRIFISADWFSDWQSWSRQARAALNAAIGGECDPLRTVQRSTEGYPVSGTPHFLIDEADAFGKPVTAIWINALCPSESEFTATVAEAKSLIAERQRVIARDGHAGLTAALAAEAPHYNPLNNASAGKVSELFD